MSFQLNGLTDFQRDLLQVAQRELPKETTKIMRKIGSKARTQVAKEARSKVKKHTGNYHKKFKRGKVFINRNNETVVRVINSSPHAHLIEHGHVIKNKLNGDELGFVRGKKIVDKGIQNFDNSGQYESMLSEWLDQLLRDGKL